MRRDSLIRTCLTGSVVMYILSVFLVSAIEGLSRLAHLSLFAVLVSLVLLMATRGLKLRFEPVLLLAWAFFVFVVISIFWSTNEFNAAERATGLFFSVLGATAVWVSFWNGVSLRTVAIAVLVAAVVLSGIALNQYYLLGAERAGGLSRATTLALQLSLSAFVIVAGLRPRPDQLSWPVVLAVGILVLATVVSGTRKLLFSWASFLLLISGYVFTRLRSSTAYRALVLFGLPVTVLALLVYGDLLLEPIAELEVYQRTELLFEADKGGSAEARLTMASEALALWSEAPIVGHGFEQFRHISSFSTYSHNNYLELMANLGLLGLVLYYAIHLLILARAVGGFARDRAYAGLVFASVLLILLWDIGSVSHTSRVTWIFIAIIGFLSHGQPKAAGVVAGAPEELGGSVDRTRSIRGAQRRQAQ